MIKAKLDETSLYSVTRAGVLYHLSGELDQIKFHAKDRTFAYKVADMAKFVKDLAPEELS